MNKGRCGPPLLGTCTLETWTNQGVPMSTENSERDYKDPLRSYNPATSVILAGYRPRLSEYSVKVPLA